MQNWIFILLFQISSVKKEEESDGDDDVPLVKQYYLYGMPNTTKVVENLQLGVEILQIRCSEFTAGVLRIHSFGGWIFTIKFSGLRFNDWDLTTEISRLRFHYFK